MNAAIAAAVAGLAILLVICTGGCDRSPAERPRPPLSVVCSTYPMVEIVQAVGGERVQVGWFIESGHPVFEWQPSVEQQARWRSADLTITLGRAEPWAIQGLSDPYRSPSIVLVESVPAAQDYASETYLWLDLRVVRELVGLVRDRLTVREVRHEAYFRDNAAAYIEQLEHLEREFGPGIAAVGGRKVLVLHGRWDPLAKWLGLEVVQPVTVAADAVGPRELAVLRRAVDAEEVEVLLIETDTAPAVVRELERRVGVRAVVLDPLGTSAPAGRNGYLEIMRYNLEQLVDAWE